MRLDEPIEAKGVFWLPDTPDDQTSGILRVSESGETRLEVFGVSGNLLPTPRELATDEALDIERILGIVEGNRLVTLEGCMRDHVEISLIGKTQKGNFYVSYVLFGALYEKDEDVNFSEFRFSVEGLSDWLFISGIDFCPDKENNKGAIYFKLPEDISINLDDETTLEIIFNIVSHQVTIPVTDARISQKSYFYLKSKRGRSIEDLRSLVDGLRNFISLGVNQFVSVNSLTGYIDMASNQSMSKPIEIYGKLFLDSNADPNIRYHDTLFKYKDIADELEMHLVKWLDAYKEFETVFRTYFIYLSNISPFLGNQFLSLAQGIEGLHRRSSNDKEMGKKEFDNLIKRLVYHCPEERVEWLKNKLSYANEPSLKQRIQSLSEPFKDWFGSGDDFDNFVNKVVNTRHYLTHYDENNRKKSAFGDDLWKLTHQLEALFQLHLLRLIGIDVDLTLKNNTRFHRKIRPSFSL